MPKRSTSASLGSRLAGKRVLVTGGAGFIGSHIVDLLLDEQCAEIIVIDSMCRGRTENLAQALRSQRVRVVEDDIRNRALMAQLLRGVDTVFHQAALRITQCVVEPRVAVEVMVNATFDLIEECLNAGIRKVVAASSASVYGMADLFPTPETQNPYNNRTLYGAAKAFDEGMLRAFHDTAGLDYVALRYFNVYGPRMDIYGRYTEVLIRWMERLAMGQPPVIFGDGTQSMDMIHVHDVARANILSAVGDATDIALNIGSGHEISLLALAEKLAGLMGRPNLRPLHEDERSVNPVPRRQAAIGRARQSIGFEAALSLDEGLDDLVSWWRSQGILHAVSEPAA